MCFSYFESFLNWVTVFIEAVDIETSLTVLSNWSKNLLGYSSCSTSAIFYFLANFFSGLMSFYKREKSEVTIVRLFYIYGSVIRSGYKTGTIFIGK